MLTSGPAYRSDRSAALCEFGWWFIYLAIALFASRPLGASIGSVIPIGCENEATVPLLNVWTLWWNSDRAAAGLMNYWDAPIFYPTKGTFAFSESQPTMILVAPIVWLTDNPVLAYNVYLLLVLSLNGSSCRRLLMRIGHRPWLAFCGGVLCEMLPFVWWQLGVIQLTTVFGINWTLHAMLDVFDPSTDVSTGPILSRLTRLIEYISDWGTKNQVVPVVPTADQPDCVEDTTRAWPNVILRGIRLGGSFCLTYWMCNYWGLFLVLVATPASIWLWNRRFIEPRFWIEVALAIGIVAMLVGPIAYVQRSLAGQHRWTRERSLILDLSAHPQDYLDTPRTVRHSVAIVRPNNEAVAEAPAQNNAPYIDWSLFPRLEFPEAERANSWVLGGGTLKLLLAPVGVISALLVRRRRRWGLFLLTFALVAFGISLGPRVLIAHWMPVGAGLCPYEMLQKYIPGFSLIRSPFRFALFVQLAIVWLCVEAIDLLDPRRWRRPHCTSPSPETLPEATRWNVANAAWLAPMLIVSLITIFEVWPTPQKLYARATSQQVPFWAKWLRQNSKPTDAVICLPFPNGYSVHHYEETTEWMYWGIFHGRPLVNGYSGFFPEKFVTIKDQLSVAIEGNSPQLKMYAWDNPGLKALNASGARFVIFKRSFASRDDVWEHPVTKFRWALVTSDEREEVDIYEIQPE